MQVSGVAGGDLEDGAPVLVLDPEDGAPVLVLDLDAHAFQHAPRTADRSHVYTPNEERPNGPLHAFGPTPW